MSAGAGKQISINTTILALETQPGVLLKLTIDTSNDQLLAAAMKADVRGTCGHVVSLIIAAGGVHNAGLMLLGNQIKKGIIKMQA